MYPLAASWSATLRAQSVSPKIFMDHNHHRRLRLDLRVDDKGLHCAIVMLDLHPLAVPG